MKKAYSKPQLVRHGDVATITQILGSASRADFVFSSGGSVISGSNDLGSVDLQGDSSGSFSRK